MGLARAHPLTKTLAMEPSRYGPVTVHPTCWGVGPRSACTNTRVTQRQTRTLFPNMPRSMSTCLFLFLFLFLTLTFQLLDKLWSQVSYLLPPGTCLQFLSRIGFSIPTARRFSSNVANSRFRAFRESICAQEKAPTNVYEYALGGTRTHEIDL